MDAATDMTLLQEYAATKSESAFAALISQHINFVYSTALRHVRDPHLAEEVTQAVFIILARKAAKINPNVVLTGWLFNAVRFTASAQLKAARRRQFHEYEAHMESVTLQASPDPNWEPMAPLLDEALARLSARDRQAVLLRYFENKSLAQIGAVLAVSEEAARKRVGRAVDKLRQFFARKGVVLSAALIASALSAHGVQAAPAGLAATISAGAAGEAATAASTLALVKGALKLMALAKLKVTAAVGAAALLATGTGVAVDKLIMPSRGSAAVEGVSAAAAKTPDASPGTQAAPRTGAAQPAAAPAGAGFSYAGFQWPTQLIFQADAALLKDRVRLTPSARGKVGAVWLQEREGVADGFETTFQFEISERGGNGGDGLAFVVQNGETPLVGQGGFHMGIGGGMDVLAVKFRNYHWRGKSYVRYDEIAVAAGTAPLAGKWGPVPLASVTNGVAFSDAKVHTARVTYAGGQLRVFLDDLETPRTAVSVDVGRTIKLGNGRAWVGLTAATGADYQNHDVLAWSFTGSASTATETGVAPGARPVAQPVPAEPIFKASPEVTVPRDAAFGYALPAGIELNYRIETSADLQHWSPLTNLALYFKDPESTNFNQRFYRFLPK